MKQEKIYEDLVNEDLIVIYDTGGSIGKRYRRQDEIGTPICLTVDFESLENQSITLRDRDSMKQIRIPIQELKDFILNYRKKLVDFDAFPSIN